MHLPPKVKRLGFLGSGICTVIGGVVIWKDAIGGDKAVEHITEKKKHEVKDLQDKVFIVTGANTG